MQKPVNNNLRGAVALSHHFLRERVQPGDRVVDATCGNGRDTLLLARLVGPTGRVWALDVQESAVAATRRLLDESGCLEHAELQVCGHERLAEFVGAPIAAAVFNLGYLPGGSREVVTVAENTVAALQQAADLLLPRGIITVCIYTGHPGGSEEGSAVETWSASLAPDLFNVWRSRQVNRPDMAPYLLLIEKAGQ
ncbi:MAG: methyltransferase domain-containing protein [Geobacter sp.]|nr:MAG: methyltransferase domain-containing protein [Geobacter sp.]